VCCTLSRWDWEDRRSCRVLACRGRNCEGWRRSTEDHRTGVADRREVQAVSALARDWSTNRVCEELHESNDGACLEDLVRVSCYILVCLSPFFQLAPFLQMRFQYTFVTILPRPHLERCDYNIPIHIFTTGAANLIRAWASFFLLVLVTFPLALVTCTITSWTSKRVLTMSHLLTYAFELRFKHGLGCVLS
jgi:hypothetical protein